MERFEIYILHIDCLVRHRYFRNRLFGKIHVEIDLMIWAFCKYLKIYDHPTVEILSQTCVPHFKDNGQVGSSFSGPESFRIHKIQLTVSNMKET